MEDQENLSSPKGLRRVSGRQPCGSLAKTSKDPPSKENGLRCLGGNPLPVRPQSPEVADYPALRVRRPDPGSEAPYLRA